MGVLVDEKFWVMATNQMWLSFPPPDRPISNEELAEILEIGCRTFSEVLADPDYARDLEEVIALRLENAVEEMRHWRSYTHLLLSTTREEDYARFKSLLVAERMDVKRLLPTP